jgi:hypothetical protein
MANGFGRICLSFLYSHNEPVPTYVHSDCVIYVHAALHIIERSTQLGSALSWVCIATVPCLGTV